MTLHQPIRWRTDPLAAVIDHRATHQLAHAVTAGNGPYIDDHDPKAKYFIAKGYAWLAVNFRGSTGYGRDFERLNHGTWGVDDTKDCLAAADFLRGLDWVDGDRLAIVGGSYGSYMATLAVTPSTSDGGSSPPPTLGVKLVRPQTATPRHRRRRPDPEGVRTRAR